MPREILITLCVCFVLFFSSMFPINIRLTHSSNELSINHNVTADAHLDSGYKDINVRIR